MSTLESIVSLLELFSGLFIYFILPGLVFFATFALAVIIITRIGSSLLTVVFPRVPTVARPVNNLTAVVSNASGIDSFERTRLIVVGFLSISYAVVYILVAWGILAAYEALGEAVFTTRPEWYSILVVVGTPIIALLFVLSIVLVVYTLRESWRGSVSLPRTIFEWGVVLLMLNVMVPVGLFAAIFGAGELARWLYLALWWILETASRLLQ